MDIDERTRIHRLLNYKRYIDWLIEKELKKHDRKTISRGVVRQTKVPIQRGE